MISGRASEKDRIHYITVWDCTKRPYLSRGIVSRRSELRLENLFYYMFSRLYFNFEAYRDQLNFGREHVNYYFVNDFKRLVPMKTPRDLDQCLSCNNSEIVFTLKGDGPEL